MGSDPDKCANCGCWLADEVERRYGYCDSCAETLVENSRARQEWAEYHPGEPCPDIELPFPSGEKPRSNPGER